MSQYLVKNVSKELEKDLKNKGLCDSIPSTFGRLQAGLTESDINVTCSGSTFVGVFIDND
ncbi:MAG: hypothetical protein KDD45_07855 [Bdellovibrionales bacterium]|nr:hypothetical protein [Bdellovibrionales bacterium]